MFKHHKKLGKLFNKAPRNKKGELDLRSKATHQFTEALVDELIEQTAKSATDDGKMKEIGIFIKNLAHLTKTK